MKIDIVRAREGDETAFINMARRLGYTGLCFLYDEKEGIPSRIKALAPQLEKFTLFTARIVSKTVKGRTDTDFSFCTVPTQKLLRSGVDLVFDIEERSDSMHQRRSGLNQVLCVLLAEHGGAYAINASALLSHASRYQYLGRLMQNVMLCEKFKVPLLMSSFARSPLEMRSPEDLASLLRLLGVRDASACFSTLARLKK